MPDTTSIYDNPYTLMDRETGRDITEYDHLKNSMVDLLTTMVGSRIDEPEYGSYLLSLMDKPYNAVWKAKAVFFTIDALRRWEPRYYVFRVELRLVNMREGRVSVDIYGFYLLGGKRVKFNNLTLDFKKDVEKAA